MNVIIKILSLLLVCIALCFSSLTAAEPIINSDHQEVVDTTYNYFNGVTTGNQELLKQAFAMDFGHMKMVSVDKGTGKESLRVVPFKEFAGYFKKPTAETWHATILSIDIVDSKMAMVKLDFDTPKTHYIDYLVMYKINGAWKIVNKTFTMEKK